MIKIPSYPESSEEEIKPVLFTLFSYTNLYVQIKTLQQELYATHVCS